MGKYPPWVLLAYLNGNNELAPEISAAQYDIEETAPGIDTEILLQIGRLDKNIVKILRPNEKTDEKDSWHGVRLYHISQAASSLKGELANLNMADPKSLYGFIEWGMQNYPAEHYMLILSGHSCEYIGMMNDYSQDKPYIMGIPEIALVLEYIKKNLGKSIDLLIFDTCFFNNIELLYEFGQSPDSAVKTILTYRDNAPAGGLSYNEILKSMDYEGENLNSFIQNLINNSSKNLIAYNINQTSLDNIKKLGNADDTDSEAVGIFVWGNDNVESAVNINIHDNQVYNIINPTDDNSGIRTVGYTSDVNIESNTISPIIKEGILKRFYP